ncbi:MAG: amidoligase family protein [Gammaproteobacteria bacterium]|nr:amidoligase family protein [Gammaproteobacteria bacterium]
MSYKTSFLDAVIEERPSNHEDKPRRMGVEIEFAGLEPQTIVSAITRHFDGEAHWASPFEIEISDSKLGPFRIELDSKDIKQIGEQSKIAGDPAEADRGFEKVYIEAISSVASNLVPWEIVTAPIRFSDLPKLFDLVETLRNEGAKGTKGALHFAFGVHLNPDLPDLNAPTIVNYLKSFFCLHDWIMQIERPDLARRITPYINHFDKAYILKILEPDYAPDTGELVSDYLEHNPTRNRSLDMLPLFAFLKPEMVEQKVDDDRVKARPTFHYRLPNCEIANPGWNLDRSIEVWMAVERLAYNPELQRVCDEYHAELSGVLPVLGSHRSERIAGLLSLPTF